MPQSRGIRDKRIHRRRRDIVIATKPEIKEMSGKLKTAREIKKELRDFVKFSVK